MTVDFNAKTAVLVWYRVDLGVDVSSLRPLGRDDRLRRLDMNPPPSISVFEPLKHVPVWSVCFGKHVFEITFDDGNSLRVSAPFRFAAATQLGESVVQECPLDQSSLMRLAGHHVAALAVETDGTLTLHFSNGDVLVVYANDPQWEAYVLNIAGATYIV